MTDNATPPSAAASGTYAPAPHLATTLGILAPNTAHPTGDGVSRWRGDLYPAPRAGWRSSAQIAAAVRADIKAAVVGGDLPGRAAGLAYSVRKSSQREVTITVSHLQEDRAARTGAWSRRPARGERSYYDDGLVVREDVRDLARVLSRMAHRYVRSETDAASDLHNTSCYIAVAVAGGGCLA